MTQAVVTDYRVAWKIEDNVGRITVRLGSSEEYRPVPLSNFNEFMALLTLLQGPKAVYYDSDHKAFATMPSN